MNHAALGRWKKGGMGLLLLFIVILFFLVMLTPSVKDLKDYHPQSCLTYLIEDHKVILECEDSPRIAAVPPLVKETIIAYEDKRFYHHPGFDG